MAISLASPTLGNLITSVRYLLNQPNAANSFWADEELKSYINEAVRMYFAEVSSMDEGQFTKQVDLDVVSGVETVSLPADFFEMRAVFKKTDQVYYILPYQNNLTGSYSTQGGTSSQAYLPYYYFRENSLVLRPAPQFSETASLRIEYIYMPDTMLNGGDQMNSGISPIFRQLIEMYAVYKAKLKESLVNGTDTSALAYRNMQDIYVKFVETIRLRSHYPQFTIAFNPEGDSI